MRKTTPRRSTIDSTWSRRRASEEEN